MSTPFDPEPHAPVRKPGIISRLRASFLTGLIVIAPIGLTIWLLWTLMGWVDGFVLPLVPARFNPEQYIGINLRGVGVIFFLLFTIVVGRKIDTRFSSTGIRLEISPLASVEINPMAQMPLRGYSIRQAFSNDRSDWAKTVSAICLMPE
jgi:hypothetical protein